jgi:hypothetical protein
MANTDKNIVITPNNGSASDPNIVFSGANASTGPQNITLTVTPNNSGTVAFSGSAGQLLVINNDIANTLSTGGTISATGNITANNFIGNLIGNITGNISGRLANGNSNVNIPAANGNVNISAVGNANVLVVTGTGANINGTLSVSGNANVGNLGTAGLITATGNITGGNLITSGLISATGALTASSYTASNSLAGYFLANTGTTVGKIYENGNIIKLEATPATYGVALAANGTVQLSFDANGYGAIGSSSGTTGYALRIAKNTTGATTAGSILINPTVQTDVTSLATGIRTSINTASNPSPYTITNLAGSATYGGTYGANTTITNLFAHYVDSSFANTTVASNNYGWYGGLASAASTYNLYMAGTANNYMAGSLGIGSTNLSAVNLRVSKSVTGGNTAFNFVSDGTISSDVTTNAVLNRVVGITQAATFTLTNLIYNQAVQGTFGLNSTVTTQSGFTADSTLTGATNNYGFRGSIASGANRFNLYMDGTANNYIAGNFGIGTTSPAVALHVKQNGSSINVEGTDQAYVQFYPRAIANSRQAWLGFGSAGTNNFTIRNDDTGRLALESGNSNVSVFANGNVTTTVAGVANVLVVTSTGANIAGTLSATGNITGNFFIGNGSQLTGITTATSLANGNSNISIPAANGNILFSTAGNANVAIINTLGYLGIGTTNPFSAVQIGGDSTYRELRLQRAIDSTIAQVILFGKSRGTESAQTIVANGDTLGSILFNGNDGSGSAASSIKIGAQIDVKVDGTPGTGNIPGRIAFYTMPLVGGVTPLERMRINSSGNVGIANTAPTDTLAVTGTVYVSGSANLNSTLNVSGNTTFSGVGQRIFGDFSNATLASRTAIQDKTTNNLTFVPVLPNGSNVNAALGVFNSSSPGNSSYGAILIDSTKFQLESGNVGTGTYLPMTFAIGGSERARFDTAGIFYVGATGSFYNSGLNAKGYFYNAGDGKALSVATNASAVGYTALAVARQSSDGQVIECWRGASIVGSVTVGASSTTYNTSSDYRLKDNPQPLTGSGAFIDALQPKTWTWKINGEIGTGFIAHEVAEIAPSSVFGEKDAVNEDGTPRHQAMEYGSAEFIANIIAELQDLRRRFAELQAEVNNLKNP